MRETTVLEFIEQELGEADYAAWSVVVDLDLGGLPVIWNTRLRTTAGRCMAVHARDDAWGRKWKPTRIILNPKLKDEGPEAVRSTFLHELAHVVVCQLGHDENHGANFYMACNQLGIPKETQYHNYESMTAKEKLVGYCLDCHWGMKRARYLHRDATYRHQCGATLVTDPALLRALEESGAAK